MSKKVDMNKKEAHLAMFKTRVRLAMIKPWFKKAKANDAIKS